MSHLGDTLGKSFLGSTAIPIVPVVAGAANPAEMPAAAWTVRNSAANNNFEIEIFDLPPNVAHVDVRAGSVNEPWEEIPLTGPGVYVNPFAVPTGVVIKLWMRLRSALGGYSITSYYKEVVVTNTVAPTVTMGQVGANVTSLNIPWSTDTAQGTGYVLVDQVAAHTGPEVEGGGLHAASRSVTASGGQSPFNVTGLTADTAYYVHVVHVDGTMYSNVVSTQVSTQETPAGTVVTTPAEVMAAIANGDRNLLIPNQECGAGDGWQHLLTGMDFTGAPLTIQAQDPENKPRFTNAVQNLKGCHHITWRNIAFENTGARNSTFAGWFFDGNPTGAVTDSCSHITIEFCDIIDPLPDGADDSTPDPNWGWGLVRFTRFRNIHSHSNRIRYNHVQACYEACNGFNVSGACEIVGNVIDHWYFDGWRLLGCPEANYVEGQLIFAHNVMGNCIGRYNEITSASPHPDIVQIFNAASGANLAVRNVLFYQNQFAPGNLRGTNVQAGLCESKLINVAYVENVWCPRNNTHGFSATDGADGVLLERQTMCNSGLGGGATTIRIYEASGQVLIKDTLFDTLTLGEEISNPQPNLAGFELEILNSPEGLDYSGFAGPGNPVGAEALMQAMRRPADPSGRGALTPGGAFRNLPHVPLKAKAPALSALGGGQVRIDTIREPTLMSPSQVAQGGTAYTRRDIRYSASAAAGTWTVIGDVGQGDTVAVPVGAKQFQTRLWNSSGYGLWSETAAVSVS